jgi:hypothetical protein
MATKKDTEIQILEIDTGQLDFCVLGRTPLILNRMSEKAQRELLMPKGRKNAAEKAANLKHNPLEEYRASVYRDPNESAGTYLLLMATAFKSALRSAALDLPGSSKSQIGRLTFVEAPVKGGYVPIFGVPELFMSVTRSADMNRTPDIRTRAIVPEWACRLSVQFVKPILREQAVANLLAAAGITMGVGDFRPEKGKGNFGQFSLVSEDNEDFQRIVNGGGRGPQLAAIEAPEAHDAETEDLLSWFDVELKRRGFKAVS